MCPTELASSFTVAWPGGLTGGSGCDPASPQPPVPNGATPEVCQYLSVPFREVCPRRVLGTNGGAVALDSPGVTGIGGVAGRQHVLSSRVSRLRELKTSRHPVAGVAPLFSWPTPRRATPLPGEAEQRSWRRELMHIQLSHGKAAARSARLPVCAGQEGGEGADAGLQSVPRTGENARDAIQLLANIRRLERTTTSELVNKMVLEKSTVTRNIGILDKAGWICQSEGLDRRTKVISLIAAGRRLWTRRDPIGNEPSGTSPRSSVAP